MIPALVRIGRSSSRKRAASGGIDVTVESHIRRDRPAVAAHMFDPANDAGWIGGIRAARLLGDPPLAQGDRVAREAGFLGRTIRYVNEVVELEPGRRLDMRSVQAPFPMRVTYEVHDASAETCLARIRVRGEPAGFFRFAGRLLPRLVRRNVRADLERLRRSLEA